MWCLGRESAAGNSESSRSGKNTEEISLGNVSHSENAHFQHSGYVHTLLMADWKMKGRSEIFEKS